MLHECHACLVTNDNLSVCMADSGCCTSGGVWVICGNAESNLQNEICGMKIIG